VREHDGKEDAKEMKEAGIYFSRRLARLDDAPDLVAIAS
jgi:hypothetical protein